MSKSITINVSNSRYAVVRNAARSLDYRLLDEDPEDASSSASASSDWNLLWQDTAVNTAQLLATRSHQRLNHWPGMTSLHTKTGLAATMRRIGTVFPDEYGSIHPQTWSLPEEWRDFTAQFEAGGPTRTYIVKPAAACQGRGIYLVRDLAGLQDPRANQIAQRYLARPLLVDGFKFDCRIYILVTSVDPLRVWLFDEGLARFATTPYSRPTASNLSKVTQHLTNYAINSGSSNFVFNAGGTAEGGTGSKRTLTWLRQWLDAQGHGAAVVWGRIVDMIVKVAIAAQPHLARTYRSAVGADAPSTRCFEVLGLDVILDAALQPWLLEVNHSPSFTCDTPLDTQVKFALIKETLQILRLRSGDKKRALAAEAEAARARLYGGGGIAAAAAAAAAAAVAAADAADAPRSAAEAASASSAAAAPSGPHVRVTARPFADCAASVSPELAAHEVKIAKGYSLIFPPPDPSSIHPSVWEGNRALHAAAAANRAAAEEAAAKAKARARAGEDDAVEPGAAAVVPPPSTLPAPTPRETAELSAAWGGWSFAPDGVPRPFYRPWDVSLEACEARIARYRTLLDVSRELYAVETAAAATGGKRAAQAAVESTAPAFAAAAARAAASAAGESGPSEDGAAPGPEPPAPAAAQATFARLLRALATESAEKAKGAAAAAAAAATGGGSTASAMAGARAFGAGRSTGAATPLAGRPSTTGLLGRRPGTVGTLPPSGAAAAATRPPRGEAGGAESAGRRPGSGFARVAAAAAAAAAEGGASSTATLPRPMSGKSDGVGSVAESGVSSGGSETGGEGDGGGGSSAPGAAHRSLRRAASFTRGGGGSAAAAGGGVRTSPSLLVPVVMLGSDELFPLPLAAAQPPQPEGRGIAAAGPRKQPLRLSVSAFGASKVPSPSLPVTPLVVPGGGAFFPPSASGVAGTGGGALAAARALRAGMANGGGPPVPAVVPSPYLKRVRAKMLEAATRSIPAIGANEEATLWSEG